MKLVAPLTPLRPKDWLHDLVRADSTSPDVYQRRWEPRLARRPVLNKPISQACSAEQIYNTRYRQWVDEMRQPYVIHRKQWEWVYILQCLEQTGQLIDGNRGLGFGVGTEPITAVAAKRGCKVLATDFDPEQAASAGWTETNQHAVDIASLNTAGVCDPEVFEKNVDFRVVDMRNVPTDLHDFDFTWSACAFEHLGSLEAGFDFVRRSLDCLRPGGIAVHTTEYNVSSDDDTVTGGHTVLYRRQDFQRLAREFRGQGHHIQLTFGLGDTEDDRHIDEHPFTNCHLKVRHEGFVITSFGLLIQKATG